MRKLSIKHRTEFHYASPAVDSVNEVRLSPVDGPRQQVLACEVAFTPAAETSGSIDVYGNQVRWGQLVHPHDTLVIDALCTVEVHDPVLPVDAAPHEWDEVASERYRDEWAEFLVPSSHIAWSDAVEAFSRGLGIGEGGGVAEWGGELAAAINASLVYEQGATDVTTTVEQVIAHGRGVCQDFAHVFLAVARMRGVPARYISGWLYEPERSAPAESHAWVEYHVPGFGWLEADPTHPGEVGDRYVRIAVGRDYWDVVPVKGTYRGGVTTEMRVRVEMTQLGVAHVAG